MHVPLTITNPSSALATIGAVAGTATAVIGLISTIIVNQRKTATKLDAIHVLVNGNLSQVKDELKAALTRIEALQGNMEGVHETTDARHNVTDAQAHASVEMVHARTDSPRDTLDTRDTQTPG
jgi:hypothetical protein